MLYEYSSNEIIENIIILYITAWRLANVTMVEMIPKEASDVRAGGPPAVTKNEKSSSLFKTAS